MSDFFGSMSGLPYPWKLTTQSINQIETDTLYNIYNQLYLAVTWEQATATVQYSSYVVNEGTIEDPILVTYYSVTGITLTDSGGGYGRGGEPAPLVTLSNGGTAVALIGTNDMDAASVGGGSFGRITQLTLTSAGPDTTTIPTITIQAPPTATLPVTGTGAIATGGTNTSSGTVGWPGTMNSVVQQYIDQANQEIQTILTDNGPAANLLNTYWNVIGAQLLIEQRARYIGIPTVVIPKDYSVNPYPTSINVFVDSIPNIAQDTRPHMAAQTLEAISDLNTLGGQSTVAQMRQERNQQRLITAGIPLDNNISTGMSGMDQKTLTTNNTIPAGINNVIESPTLTLINSSPETYGDITNGVVGFTNPAWSANEIGGAILTPVPGGVYVPSDTNLLGDFIPALTITEGDISSILSGNPVPVVNTIVPASLDSAAINQSALNPAILNPAILNLNGLNPAGINPLAADPSLAGLSGSPSSTGSLGLPGTTVDNTLSPNDAANRRIVIVSAPNQLDTNIPLNLDTDYTGSTMLPSAYSIAEAIDKVIECNCDCWVD
jgi:hypothetical protein